MKKITIAGIGSILMAVGLAMASTQAQAQNQLYPELFPGLNAGGVPGRVCPERVTCGVIAAVEQDVHGGYHCTSREGAKFGCSALVKENGVNVEGLPVKITVPYVDTCHLPGKCGPKACYPIYAEAALDYYCQN